MHSFKLSPHGKVQAAIAHNGFERCMQLCTLRVCTHTLCAPQYLLNPISLCMNKWEASDKVAKQHWLLLTVVVVCGAAQKATAMITQKPHSGTDLHIGSPSAAIESEILCFDYNLWPTSAAPLIALNPAPIIMRAMNA